MTSSGGMGGWNGGGKDVGMKEWEDGWKEGRWCKSKEGRAHGVGNGRHTAVNLLGYIEQQKKAHDSYRGK